MFVMKACFCIIIRFNSQHRIAYLKQNACHKCGWANFSWPIPHIYCIYYYNHLACEFGYYGLGCNQECSTFCKKSRYCNSISGHCKDGCKSGWQGLDCLEGQFVYMLSLNRYIVKIVSRYIYKTQLLLMSTIQWAKNFQKDRFILIFS